MLGYEVLGTYRAKVTACDQAGNLIYLYLTFDLKGVNVLYLKVNAAATLMFGRFGSGLRLSIAIPYLGTLPK